MGAALLTEAAIRLRAAGAQGIMFCANAQGIVLGCTEFPLIIKSQDVSVPAFDTTLLHSQMAVDFILGKEGLAHIREHRAARAAAKAGD